MHRPQCPDCRKLMSTALKDVSYICELCGVEAVKQQDGTWKEHYWKTNEEIKRDKDKE